MTHPFESPKPTDSILGGQPVPVTQAVVLGGTDGLLQRFPHLSPEAQQAAIWQLIDQGEAGLQQVIDTLKSPHRSVRRTAYELLQMMPVEAAQNEIAPGFPIFPGEVIYQVHESGIIYNDCWYYLIHSVNDNQADYPTKFLERYIDLESATLAVQKFHQLRSVKLLTSGCYFLLSTAPSPIDDRVGYADFDMLAWCREHNIPIRWPNETPEEYSHRFAQLPAELSSIPAVNQWFLQEWRYATEPDQDDYEVKEELAKRVVAFLNASCQHELSAQLWLEVVGCLAFIHEQPVYRLTYCDILPDGAIVVLKNF